MVLALELCISTGGKISYFELRATWSSSLRGAFGEIPSSISILETCVTVLISMAYERRGYDLTVALRNLDTHIPLLHCPCSDIHRTW